MSDSRLFLPFFDLHGADDRALLAVEPAPAPAGRQVLDLTAVELELAAAILSPRYYDALAGRPPGKAAAAFCHFITEGIHTDIAPSPLFDPRLYAERLRAVGHALAADQAPSFLHWLRVGLPLRIVPTRFFDEAYYLRANPDIAAAGMFGFRHFLLDGMQEGRSPNGRRDVVAEFGASSGPGRWNSLDTYVQRRLLTEGGFDAIDDTDVAAPEADSLAPSAGFSLEWRWRAGGTGPVTAPGDPLQRYFDGLSFEQADVLAWVKLVPSCWPHSEKWEGLSMTASRVRESGAFDEDYYLGHSQVAETADPAMHYVLVGEPLGLAPSAQFDPRYYASRYRDVSSAGMSLLLHYVDHGRSEGRHGVAPCVRHVNPKRFDPARENVVVAVHETSRTGAPILGWNIAVHLAERYNVHTICLGGGALTAEFDAVSAERFGPFSIHDRQQTDLRDGLRALFAGRTFAYAIVNSCESRALLEVCAEYLVPTLFLMHEFASYVHPAENLRRAFDAASEIVFSAPIIARAAEIVHPPLRERHSEILPQGMSLLPSGAASHAEPPAALAALAQEKENGTFIVLGAGSVEFRKGVDLFIAAAAATLRHDPARPVHFVWIGRNYRPDDDVGYSVYLREQMQRSGAEPYITFLGEMSELDSVYALADTFLLASRLDPLPNVCIDAAARGIPIVCFHDASGMADLMAADPATAEGVVPHLDADAAGRLIARFASDEPARRAMAAAISHLAETHFDMHSYVDRLDQLGRALAPLTAQRRADLETLLADPTFDQDLFLGAEATLESRAQSIARYLAHVTTRRPAPGFDAVRWQSTQPGGAADPLASFVRAGRPAGPWQSPVLRPAPTPPGLGLPPALLHLRCATAAQYDDLLAHLAPNRFAADARIVVAVETDAEAETIRRSPARSMRHPALAGAVGAALGTSDPLDAGAIIGHFEAGDPDEPDPLREFEWQALLGPRHAMGDRILAAFADDPALGLVFPADPRRPIRDDADAAAAAAKFGHQGELAGDYPQGGAFWARRAVLDALASRLGDLSDVSDEALARLLPVAARSIGMSYAVAHVPGVVW